MSYKRSRATFEADHPHAPFATFGTPLPDEAEARDDGSFVPVWKQEVRDDRGRKRLHGAFTGGWSAGYFNTVGSKEGWTPSTFVSSRTDRRKDDEKTAQERAEAYMDEEDLADAAEAQQLQTSQAFAGLGSSTQENGSGGLMGLFRAQGDTMGFKLLRKMGWKDGQGIGPRIRRSARLDLGPGKSEGTHLFAPDNVPMVQFNRKMDTKGLGHGGEQKLSAPGTGDRWEDEDEQDQEPPRRASLLPLGRSKKPQRGGIGVGTLNDTGSDEDDPYEMGPKIKYNRVIGGDKKKKLKKANAAINPSLGAAPTFVPRSARAGNGLRRCHDGRLPLDGFVLAKVTEDLGSMFLQYAPPSVPEGWVSKLVPSDGTDNSKYVSSADAAKASTHDPRSRAAILGEKALPGKSVFDYISSTARDKLAAASGKSTLPQGRGEIPEEYRLSEEEKQKRLWEDVPKLDQETAIAAIARSAGGPYADDEEKRERFRSYLDYHANPGRSYPTKPKGMPDSDYLREMNEFFNCARIFKPMTGFMASRFTTAKTVATPAASANAPQEMELLSKPEPKVTDPAEEAAKMGMFGNMTRSTRDFYPTRLLCKRFNVKPPVHVRPDNEPEVPPEPRQTGPWPAIEPRPSVTPAEKAAEEASAKAFVSVEAKVEAEVNPERNDAVEGQAAHAEVLRAIFGDSDSE